MDLNGIQAGGWLEILGIVRRSNITGGRDQTSIEIYFGKEAASIVLIKDGLCRQLRAFTYDPARPLEAFLEDIAKYISEIRFRHSVERFDRLIISGDVSRFGIPGDELSTRIKEKIDVAGQVLSYTGKLKSTGIKGLEEAVGASFAGMCIGTYKIDMLPHRLKPYNFAIHLCHKKGIQKAFQFLEGARQKLATLDKAADKRFDGG